MKGEKRMRGRSAKIAGILLIATIILIAIGYAAITNVELKISGTGNAQANKDNFIVEFIGIPTTGGKGKTQATIDTKDATKGNMTVSGLTAKGDTATATYTVKNKSADISADLTAKATSSNENYFETICTLDKTTLKAQEETTLTVTIKLLKTPINETKEDLTSNIGVSITAEPKQPGEEANGGSSTVTSNKPTTSPYLPTGFTQVDGTNLSKGLTIQDSKGNQYVWVEVPKTSEVYPTAGLNITEFTTDEYTKIETDLHTYTNDYRESEYNDGYYSDETTGLTSAQYTELKQKMLKSVYKNGGFYVGKYETGIENAPKTSGSLTSPTEIPVIKQNAYPYNYVTCKQAQTLASKMESGNYTSSLMFGVQWDLVLKYLETKGTAQADLKTDSTSWGNYGNNLWNITNENSKYSTDYGSNWTSGAYGKKDSEKDVLLSTRASDKFSKQGIYDLAGNVWEWTLEYTSNSYAPCTSRGGAYHNNGDRIPAAYRTDSDTTDIYGIGFRVSLF